MVVRRWSPDTLLNGCQFTDAPLNPGDRLSIGPIELEVVLPGTVPELPRLLHAALQPREDSALMQTLVAEQRRTNRLLRAALWVAVGFAAGLLVAQLLLRFAPGWR